MLFRILRCARPQQKYLNSKFFTLANNTNLRSLHKHVHSLQKRPTSWPIPTQQWSQVRRLAFIAGAKRQLKHNPISFTLALLFIICGSGGLLYTAFLYQSYFVQDFIRYPDAVAAKLRRALYYTNISLDPPQALRYYNQALELAEEHGMDPFGDEVLGIRVQVAQLLQKVGRCDLAAQVLEAARSNCLEWIESKGNADELAGRRNRILQKTVSLSVKLGELYADPHVGDRETAEDRLVWAVETVVRENKRRDEEGVKTGEGDWMSDEEIGGSLEALAHHYIAKEQYYLATPLLLRSLALSQSPSCHTAMLMSNIATTFAQQPPPSSPYPTPLPSSPTSVSSSSLSSVSPSNNFFSTSSSFLPFLSPFSPPPTNVPRFQPALSEPRIQQITQSRQWADKALAHVRKIPAGAGRTEECDHACVAAMHSLGEFAEMLGEMTEAKEKYGKARDMAKDCDYEEGKAMANEGLRRLKKNKK